MIVLNYQLVELNLTKPVGINFYQHDTTIVGINDRL